MGISMSVRQHLLELGPSLDEGSVPWEVPRDALSIRDTPLLAGVDPYGYTVFNRVQIDDQLPREIAFLRHELDPTSTRRWTSSCVSSPWRRCECTVTSGSRATDASASADVWMTLPIESSA